MKYFLPDAQDLVDPSFDFDHERRSATRLRQRDDLYAHEVFDGPALDGILVSKGIVDGFDNSGSRYTLAQRHRLLRAGAREFFRLSEAKKQITTMGDCGAFTYAAEKVPPYSVDDVISFYLACGFDYGISVDHVILAFDTSLDDDPKRVPAELRARQKITLDLARDFLRRRRADRLPFEPLGVAQGWSPKSYAHATTELQKMGYRYIAVGGMVPLRTTEILLSLAAIDEVRRVDTRLHLLGVTRTENLREFDRMGVASFDSTSPLRQAFKDDKDNYYTPTRTYTAVRIPQVEGNAKLQKLISSGKLPQGRARELEKGALRAMGELDRGTLGVQETLDALRRYDDFCGSKTDHTEVYREVLTERPWKACPCEICRALGHHVILFRGAERNRRRGFHNTWVFYRRLQRQIAAAAAPVTESVEEPEEAAYSCEGVRMTNVLRLPAIEVRQSADRVLYTFAVDAKMVPLFSTVSRIHRTGEGGLRGYQRPEVLAHIAEIRNYIESESPMIPNAVVIAFDSRVSFEPHPGPCAPYSRMGTLVIPVDEHVPEENRPGFIVDGQQRLAAIRDAAIESFPVCVSAFITDDVREQTEQFILVNSTKPLPKGLIYELLPGTEATLPSLLQRRRLPAHLLTRMNQDAGSPLRDMIQTITNPGGQIKDNSILRMVENSLSDGVLYRLREGNGADDIESMLGLLYGFWRAVAHTFPEAWLLPAKRSRLVHGAGIVSMGFVMDAISERYRSKGFPNEKAFARDLEPLKPFCRWTDGIWDFGPHQQRKWNEIQNTTKDVQLLANYLLVQYKALVWNRAPGKRGGQLALSADST